MAEMSRQDPGEEKTTLNYFRWKTELKGGQRNGSSYPTDVVTPTGLLGPASAPGQVLGFKPWVQDCVSWQN